MFNNTDTDCIDVFMFDLPEPEINNHAIKDFCTVNVEAYVHNAIGCIVGDNDFSMIDGFSNQGLHAYVKDIVESTIHTIYEDDESHDPEIVHLVYNHQIYVQNYLYVSYLSMYNNMLTYIPGLFQRAKQTGLAYRDYALSSTGSHYILRLVRGIPYGS